jgi:hypothetical protein
MTAVWFIGNRSVRTINVAAWAATGVTVDTDDVWSVQNGWSIPETDFTEQQLNVLAQFPDFYVGAPDGPRIRQPDNGFPTPSMAEIYYRLILQMYEDWVSGSPTGGVTIDDVNTAIGTAVTALVDSAASDRNTLGKLNTVLTAAIATLSASVNLKAIDTAVVHKTGNEVVAGSKTYQDTAVFNEAVTLNEDTDFGGKNAKNAADPVDDQDLVTKAWFSANGGSGGASESYVDDAVSTATIALVDGADTDHDTLNKLAAAITALAQWLTNQLGSYALDSAVVHLASSETLTGAKTFSALLTANNGIDLATSVAKNAGAPTNSGDLVNLAYLVANYALTTDSRFSDMRTPTDGSVTSAKLASALATVIAGKLDSSSVGVANGIAPLDATAKISSTYLPSYVDDVLEVANFAALPTTGESGKIYVTQDTNFEYRWSGSAYIQLVASPGSTDAVPEGSTNLYFTYVRGRDAANDSIDNYVSNNQLQVYSAILASLAGLTGASDNDIIQRKSGVFTNRTPAQVKTDLALAKADVGLGSVDNTADAAKSVSYAATAGSASTATTAGSATGNAGTATKLATARNIAGQAFDGTADITAASLKTGLALTKADVGLTLVDNTADVQKACLAVNSQTGTTYTLAQGDIGKVIELNNAAAITLTVPDDSVFSSGLVGACFEIWQVGAGQVTISPASGSVLIYSSGSKKKLTGQYSGAVLRWRGSNTWALIGDLSA